MLQVTRNIKINGFTFIELIIAVFIFITGILGAFMIAQYFIFDTQKSISRLTASFLAQEGIEIVRNLRDENWLNNRDWDSGLATGVQQSDYNDTGLGSLVNNGLLYLDANGFYNHDSGSPTKFERRITIVEATDIDGQNNLKITVSVSWQERGQSFLVEAQEKLYPWWSD